MSQFYLQLVTTCDAAYNLLEDISLLPTSKLALAPSLQPCWLKVFTKYYGPCRNLAFTVISDESGLNLIAPFQTLTTDAVTFICDETSDYNDLIWAQIPAAIDSLQLAINYWLAMGVKCFTLSKIPCNSVTIEIARQVAARLGLEFSLETCDYIPIRRLFPGVPVLDWPGINKSRVEKYQYYLQQLVNHSNVRFDFINSESDLSTFLPIMMGMHIDRWNQKGIISKFQDEKRRLFTNEICLDALRSHNLFAPLLFIDNELAAYQLGFCYGTTIYNWNTSFALRFRKWSPGMLLLLYIFSETNIRFDTYNFLRGEEAYKYYWTNEQEYSVTVTLQSL